MGESVATPLYQKCYDINSIVYEEVGELINSSMENYISNIETIINEINISLFIHHDIR